MMTADLLLLVGIIVLLIIASAFFSSAETALTAASDARMRQLAGKGNRRASLVERLRDDRDAWHPLPAEYPSCTRRHRRITHTGREERRTESQGDRKSLRVLRERRGGHARLGQGPEHRRDRIGDLLG